MRRPIAFGLVASVFGLAVFACSSDDSNGATNAGSDAATHETSTSDAIAPGNDGAVGACPPTSSVDSSQVSWIPPHAPQPTACSDAQLTTIFDACYGSGSSSAGCNTLLSTADYASCNACLFSTFSEGTSSGAIIHLDGADITNAAGCYALLVGDVSDTGCGAKFGRAGDCEILACSSCRPLSGSPISLQQLGDCENAAASGACATFDQQNCGFADGGVPDAGAAYEKCIAGSSFQTLYDFTARLFCGGYPTDGGTDAGHD